MIIKPTYTNLNRMFASQAIYYVPTYQRAYAWEDDALKDYLTDLHECYNLRIAGNVRQHFFGGILSIKHDIDGTVDKYSYEIIDGQQRMTTFTLTSRGIMTLYEKFIEEIKNSDPQSPTLPILSRRVEKLKERCIEFIQEVNLVEKTVKVLTISKRDKTFYSELMKMDRDFTALSSVISKMNIDTKVMTYLRPFSFHQPPKLKMKDTKTSQNFKILKILKISKFLKI